MSRVIERAARIAAIGVTALVSSSGLPTRSRKPVELYLLVTGCNLPGAVAAVLAGCTRQNVSKLLRSVEDRREDPAFDRLVSGLERQLFGEL